MPAVLWWAKVEGSRMDNDYRNRAMRMSAAEGSGERQKSVQNWF